MSEERTVTDLQTGSQISLSEALEKDPEEYKRLRAERKARFSRVLERGMIADRLKVDLPPHLWGEWVHNDRQSITEMQLLGFKIDTEYAPKRALHDQGDGMSLVGDTLFMVQDIEDHNLLEEIRRENYAATHGKAQTVNRLQGEEREFSSSTRTLGLPTIEESASKQARKAELESALAQTAQARNAVQPGARIIK